MAPADQEPKPEFYASVWWTLSEASVILLGKLRPDLKRLFIYQEFVEENSRLHRIIEKLKEYHKENPLEFIFCKDKPEEYVRDLVAEDLPAYPQVFDEHSEILAINLTSRILETVIPDVGPALVFSRDCKLTLEQLNSFRVKKGDPQKPAPDKPYKVHHQAVEALHLMILGLFNSPNYQVHHI
jgi:hypothetical protein